MALPVASPASYIPAPGGALSAIALAAKRRIDLVMIGDSTVHFNGFGLYSAFQIVLGRKYGIYASPLFPQEINSTQNSASVGQPIFAGISGVTNSSTSGSVAAHDTYSLLASTGNSLYCYQNTGDMGQFNGLYVDTGSVDANGSLLTAFNYTANLRCHYSYGTFLLSGGTFVPAARYEGGGYATLVTGSSVNCQTGVDGRAITKLDLAAGTRAYDFSFKWRLGGGVANVGKTTQFWQRVENIDVQSGVSIHSLLGWAGKSLYTLAQTLLGYSAAQLANFMTDAAYLQVQAGQDPILVFVIGSGFNDEVETLTPSLGPRPSSSPTSFSAYIDNLRAIVSVLHTACVTANVQDYYLVMPSYPKAAVEDAFLPAYRIAAARHAAGKTNMSAVNMADIVSFDDLTANGGYSGNPHLSKVAYQYMINKFVASLVK